MEVIYLNKNLDRFVHQDSVKEIPRDRLVWIRLTSPDEEQIKIVAEVSRIPVEEFKEFIEDEERSRVEYAGYLQIIYLTPITEKNEVNTEPISLFIRKNLIVTLGKNLDDANNKIVRQIKSNILKFTFRKGAGTFVNFMLDKVNDEFFKRIERIARIAKIQKSEDIDVQSKSLIELYNSNVVLSNFNQAIIANLEVTNSLRKNRFRQFTDEDRENFSDLHYDLLSLLDTLKVQRDVVMSIFNFQSVFSSYKLNNFIKNLTSLALIVMVPTLISSIYGMNLKLPFGSSPYGFLLVSIVMIGFTLGFFLLFKKIDWL